MALYYSKPMNTQYLYRLIAGTATTWSFTIYAGTQPSANNYSANWVTSSYYNSFLVHWIGTGTTWRMQNATTYSGFVNQFMEINTYPVVSTSYTSTTQVATWGILWPAAITQATILAATGAIPNTSYIVVPVTDLGGKGVIRLANTTIDPATVYDLNDVTLAQDNSNPVYIP